MLVWYQLVWCIVCYYVESSRRRRWCDQPKKDHTRELVIDTWDVVEMVATTSECQDTVLFLFIRVVQFCYKQASVRTYRIICILLLSAFSIWFDDVSCLRKEGKGRQIIMQTQYQWAPRHASKSFVYEQYEEMGMHFAAIAVALFPNQFCFPTLNKSRWFQM